MTTTRRLLATLLLAAAPSIARSQAFVKVSVKPAASTSPTGRRLEILPNGDLIANAIPLIELLSLAYDVPNNPSPRVTSLPEWAAHKEFDIEAKAPPALNLGNLDIAAQRRIVQQLIRRLLADRFGLVLSVRNQSMPVYALSVATGGPRLKRAAITSSECILDTDAQSCHSFAGGLGHPLNGNAVDMSDLALYLENWTDLPVVNRTKLTGLYTLHSQGWVPMRLPPPPPGATPAGNPFAGLPTLSAVLNSLGLTLVRQHENMPIYTVASIRQPRTE